jgi:hypothetical protein
MKVIDYDPQFWFLLQDDNFYYLSIRCQQSFAEYELLIQLTQDECKEHHASGHGYIGELAERVNYRVRDYQSRDISKQRGDLVHQTIMAWKSTQDEDAFQKGTATFPK